MHVAGLTLSVIIVTCCVCGSMLRHTEAAAAPQYYGVIAACARYQNPRFNLPKKPLPPFSDKKLLVLYEALLQSSNWTKDNIVLLVNDNATKENILGALEKMAGRAGPGDYFLFSWSGHGTEVIDQDGDEGMYDQADILDEAICPFDTAKNNATLYNLLTDDELNSSLSRISCRQMMLIFDCCLSGGMADRGLAGDTAGEAFKKHLRQKLSQDVNGGNRVVLMSTMAGYVERGILLTGFPLITGLAIACSHPGLSDRNKDGIISAEEAFQTAKPLVYLQSSSLWLGLWLYAYGDYLSDTATGAFLYSLIDAGFSYLVLQIESKLLTHHLMGNFPIISDNCSEEFPLIRRPQPTGLAYAGPLCPENYFQSARPSPR